MAKKAKKKDLEEVAPQTNPHDAEFAAMPLQQRAAVLMLLLGEEQAARLLRSQPVQTAMRDPRLQERLRCALPGPAR